MAIHQKARTSSYNTQSSNSGELCHTGSFYIYNFANTPIITLQSCRCGFSRDDQLFAGNYNDGTTCISVPSLVQNKHYPALSVNAGLTLSLVSIVSSDLLLGLCYFSSQIKQL